MKKQACNIHHIPDGRMALIDVYQQSILRPLTLTWINVNVSMDE